MRANKCTGEPEELAIVLRGDLTAILRFAAGKKNPDFLSEAGTLDARYRNHRYRHLLVVAVGR
jgi:hypothetical protein